MTPPRKGRQYLFLEAPIPLSIIEMGLTARTPMMSGTR